LPRKRVNNIEINYRVAGKGRYLTLVHGAHFDLTTWEPQVAYFSKRYRVVTYDLRGHGKSEMPKGPYSIDDCVEDLYRLFQYLGIQRSYLGGLSMGGNISLSFTLKHSERVDTLILAGTNSGAVRKEIRQVGVDKRTLLEAYKGMLYSTSFSKHHPDQIANWEKRFLANPTEGLIKAVKANLDRPDLTSRLSEIKKRTLIVVGAEDAVTPPQVSEAMGTRISHSEVRVIPDCGHICNEEQPGAFNSVVEEFLQRVRDEFDGGT